MFINPKIAIEKGWIVGVKDPKKQVQPNATDFTLDKVSTIKGASYISEDRKIMRNIQELKPLLINSAAGTEYWSLEAGQVYDGLSDIYVTVPPGIAAVLYTRSTFVRNGVFLMSGLYDSGFQGNIGFTICTVGGAIDIGVGTRIGQIGFLPADNAGLYAGGYNHSSGTHWNEQTIKQMEKATAINADQGGRVARNDSYL